MSSVAAILRRRALHRVPRDPATPYRLADLMDVDRERVSPIEMAEYARRRLWLSRWVQAERERLQPDGGEVGLGSPERREWHERVREFLVLCRICPEQPGEGE